MLLSTQRLIRLHKMSGSDQRLGQYFCNNYVKVFDQTTDPLFNESNDGIAAQLIDAWLERNHHREFLPRPVTPITTR